MDRESKGQQYTTRLLESVLTAGSSSTESTMTRDPSQPGPSWQSQPPTIVIDEDPDALQLGDLVAIVLPGSTPANPLVELGKAMRISQTEISYLPFENVGENNYRCTAGRLGKAARDHIVFPVGTHYHPDTKLYTLISDPVDIHKATC